MFLWLPHFSGISYGSPGDRSEEKGIMKQTTDKCDRARQTNILIVIEKYEVLEWGIDINGMLWASGDCTDPEDGERQARRELAGAGFPDSATVTVVHDPKRRVS